MSLKNYVTRSKALGPGAEHPATRFGANAHQSHVVQHPEMLRHDGSTDQRERGCQLARTALTVRTSRSRPRRVVSASATITRSVS